MTNAQIKQALVEALQEIQKKSGQECPPITDETRPFNDLPGFDSILGLEATVDLEQRLGREFPVDSVFVDSRGRALKLAAVVEAVEALWKKVGVA